MRNLLTAEESAKLIELGVSPERASEICIDFNGRYAYVCGEEAQLVRDCVNGHFYVEECRIFTLADILDIMPKEINREYLEIGADDGEWSAEYSDLTLTGSYSFAPELIDALYSLLVWCLEKGYVK